MKNTSQVSTEKLWMFGEDGEEVEDKCDEESDIDQN